MLAPIITKDMKLFPARPLPPGIKNVRSRAQSLDQFSQVQNSGSSRGRIVPVKPRNSQSTGNLPAAARSPPKASVHRKTTLTAIQEGVEMIHPKEKHTGSESSSMKSTPVEPSKSDDYSRTRYKVDKIDCGKENGNEDVKEEGAESNGSNEKKEKKGVVKWLTSAFRKSSKEKDSYDNSSTNSS